VIDVAALSPPTVILARDKFHMNILGSAMEDISNLQNGTAVTEKFLRENRDLLKRILRARAKANRYFWENERGTSEVLVKFQNVDLAVARESYRLAKPAFTADGIPSPKEIEEFLKASLGVRHILWLGDGIVGDDTDGHIDDIARFVNPTTVACITEANTQDDNYRCLRENYERLQSARDQDGQKLDIISLPCPAPIFSAGARLPASYANFYIANEVVLVPVFDDANDPKALGILQECFPKRKIIALRCNEVVAGLGAIHCVTQQEPSVR